MRVPFSALGLAWLAAASTAARADRTIEAPPPDGAPSGPALTPIALDELPRACRTLGEQARTRDRAAALDARIALASCVADHRLEALPPPCDCGESMVAMDEAIAPAVALLDEAIAQGDAEAALIAAHVKGELYAGMRVRMRAAVPPPADTTEEAIALRDSRIAVLDNLLEPWRAQATTAFDLVVDLARRNPELVRNPVVRSALASSRVRLGLVAGR